MNRVIIEQKFIPRGSLARPGIKLTNPSSITIHWVGPYPNQTPEVVRNWWIKGPDGKGIEASAHFIIKDDRIMQCIPTGEVAWHCGGKGNYTSFGIEVIPANKEGKFSDLSIDTLIYCISTLPAHSILLRHYDWTKKDCPLYYTPLSEGGQERWEWLITAITEEAWNEDRPL
jgi:N-acetylmuramoyl-L-alanine amidase CwlA